MENNQEGLESDLIVRVDSSEGDQQQHKIADISKSDISCDDLIDSTSACRLSGLVIIINCDSALED